MKRLVGLALVLAGATVYADPASTPPADPAPPAATTPPPAATPPKTLAQPLRLVRITADGKGALILDRNRNRSILVEVGDGISGYTVEAIEDDAVTLVNKTGVQLVLAVPAPSPAVGSGKPELVKAPQDPYAPIAIPADPYAAGPADPYAPIAPVPVTISPATPTTVPGSPPTSIPPTTSPTGGAPVAIPPSGASPSVPVVTPTPMPTPNPTSLAPPPVTTAGPVPSATPPPPTTTAGPISPYPPATPRTTAAPISPYDAPTATPPVAMAATPPRPAAPVVVVAADGKIELKRAEVDHALRDFAGLASSIGATFTTAGLKIDAMAPGSLFARAGLQVGDVVVAVDGKLLRSLDDAAELYARASTVRAVTVQVIRGGKPGSLQIAIR